MAKKKPGKKKPSQKELRDKELISLKRGKGLLRAVDVVEFARNPKTALHSAFEWDDTKAAHEHRLWQAEHLIVSVRVRAPKIGKPMRVFTSLKSDRQRAGGGYRQTAAVLSHARLREELLQQAWDDFKYWQEQYEHLVELAPIFMAAAKVGTQLKKRARRRASK